MLFTLLNNLALRNSCFAGFNRVKNKAPKKENLFLFQNIALFGNCVKKKRLDLRSSPAREFFKAGIIACYLF